MTTKRITRKKRKLNEISDDNPINDSDLKKSDSIERKVVEANHTTLNNGIPHC